MRTYRTPIVALVALLVVLVSACGDRTPTYLAEDYDQSCTTDDQCVPMFSGELCTGECTCPNAAISLEGAQQLERDKDDLHCNPDGPTYANCPCPETEAFCNEGTCDLREVDAS